MQRAFNAAAVRIVDDTLGPKVVDQADGDEVPRQRDARPQRDGAEVFEIPVERYPGLVRRKGRGRQRNRIGVRGAVEKLPILPIVEKADAVVVDDGGLGHAVIHRGGPDKRFERRSGLALRLRRTIKLGFFEVPAADHRANFPGMRIQRDSAPWTLAVVVDTSSTSFLDLLAAFSSACRIFCRSLSNSARLFSITSSAARCIFRSRVV